VVVRHLWQLKTVDFLHWYLILTVPLKSHRHTRYSEVIEETDPTLCFKLFFLNLNPEFLRKNVYWENLFSNQMQKERKQQKQQL
jgi:hypothetical protein